MRGARQHGGRRRLPTEALVSDWEMLVGGVDFGEGPRWRDGLLWYSDFYKAAVYTVTPDGERTAVLSDLPDRPSGLGWMPDGTLLVVFMTTRRVMKLEDGELVEHGDLSGVATGHCNDMVVDANGNAYVGNFGFDAEAGGDPTPADLALVRSDGSVEVAASDVRFPNGSAITPDGSTLIVGESYGGGYEAWTINDDATLSARRRWADIPGTAPDGCTLDSEGAIWFSDAMTPQVIRVREGGEVVDTVATPAPTYACMLGGDDGRTLFCLTAPGSHPAMVSGLAAGAIYHRRVEHARAGLP